jgi:hypothetical protein
MYARIADILEGTTPMELIEFFERGVTALEGINSEVRQIRILMTPADQKPTGMTVQPKQHKHN